MKKRFLLLTVISVLMLFSILVVHADGVCPYCSSTDVDVISETVSVSEPVWTSIEWVSTPLRCNYCAEMGDGFDYYQGYKIAYVHFYDLCYDCWRMYNESYKYVQQPAGMIEWDCPNCGRINH